MHKKQASQEVFLRKTLLAALYKCCDKNYKVENQSVEIWQIDISSFQGFY